MLPELNLDNENFDDIIEDAKNMIVSIYPKWTDFNYHDPGITMIELFAWIKESQQYYLNQISKETRMRYLKLLGSILRKKTSSHARILVNSKEDIYLPKGTQLKAGNLFFETNKPHRVFADGIEKCFSLCGKEKEVVDKYQMQFTRKLKMFLFGQKARVGSCFYLSFLSPLPLEEISLYFGIFNEYPIKRVPIEKNTFFPLADLEFSYSTDEGFKTIETLNDETYGFVQSGNISFCLDKEHKSLCVEGEEGYYLRIRLKKSYYEVPPVLEEVSLNMLEVIQKETLIEYTQIENGEWILDDQYAFSVSSDLAVYGRCEIYSVEDDIFYPIPVFNRYLREKDKVDFSCVIQKKEKQKIVIVSSAFEAQNLLQIGIGNGFPFQKFDLNDQDIADEEFELIIHEIGMNDGYSLWKKVNDFGSSSPEDKHYILDTLEGKVIFGDCIHGMAPEGEIRLISYARTRGIEGNVKAGAIRHFAKESLKNLLAVNDLASEGGQDEESLEECFLRVRREMREDVTAVTLEDYENYVKKTPGLMIESCKAIFPADMELKNNENTINLVVDSYSLEKKAGLNKRYKKNILFNLEKYRPIGTKIVLVQPNYIHLEVYADLIINPHYVDAKQEIYLEIQKYFDKIAHKFGEAVNYSVLYGVLDQMESVIAVDALSIDAKGIHVQKNSDGSIILPANGVAQLENIECTFSLAE